VTSRLIAIFQQRETTMKIARIMLTGVAALVVLGSAASAQQLTGTVTKIDRIHGTIAIKRTQSGTVGANTGGAAEEFSAPDVAVLDAVHAGDAVAFSAKEAGGTKTITKLQRQ
jgi:Cu/Ag efflux protein CusF